MASFGPGPEMQIPGRVAAWEPPHRIVFDGGEAAGGLAFEWLVEARDGGTCIVRLVNSGFGSGEPWDDQYDGMAEGWLLFLRNLQLHCEHFRGQTATAVLPMAMWPGHRPATWAALCDGLGLPASPSVGDRVAVTSTDAPPLGGTVLDADSWRLALLLDERGGGVGLVLSLRRGGRGRRGPRRAPLVVLAGGARRGAARGLTGSAGAVQRDSIRPTADISSSACASGSVGPPWPPTRQ